jgi:hypothetical protein
MIFTSAARRASAEASSAALSEAVSGAGTETDLVAGCTGATDVFCDAVFLFETEEVACACVVVTTSLASDERGSGKRDGEEEAVGTLLVAERLIVVLSEKAKIKMPKRRAVVIPR